MFFRQNIFKTSNQLIKYCHTSINKSNSVRVRFAPSPTGKSIRIAHNINYKLKFTIFSYNFDIIICDRLPTFRWFTYSIV